MTPDVFGQFLNTPLAVNEQGLRALMATGRLYLDSQQSDAPQFAEDPTHDRAGRVIPKVQIYEDGTARIPLKGVVSKGLGPAGKYWGMLDIAEFADAVQEAIDNPKVLRIGIDIDSPGGTVIGTRDAAEIVERAAKVKPTMVFTDGIMASAAYYIASAADFIVSGSSAYVGSIGVFTYFADEEKMWEECGIRWVVARSGKLKGMGIDKITEEQLAMLQAEVDSLGEEFRSFVERKRAISREDMEGQMFSGLQALERGFVHANARTFTEAVQRFKSYVSE